MARRSRVLSAFLVAALALLAACRAPEPAVSRPGATLDACAERLHEISGQLLLHYSRNRRLPASIAPAACPVSGRPYVYRPEGVSVPGELGRVVLHDPTPDHANGWWCIVILKGVRDSPTTMRVVWRPEALLKTVLPGQTGAGASQESQARSAEPD